MGSLTYMYRQRLIFTSANHERLALPSSTKRHYKMLKYIHCPIYPPFCWETAGDFTIVSVSVLSLCWQASSSGHPHRPGSGQLAPAAGRHAAGRQYIPLGLILAGALLTLVNHMGDQRCVAGAMFLFSGAMPFGVLPASVRPIGYLPIILAELVRRGRWCNTGLPNLNDLAMRNCLPSCWG
jgi:hypothetical protein